MGAKAKKALKNKLKKTSQLSISRHKNESSDFLPLEGGPGRKLAKVEEPAKIQQQYCILVTFPMDFMKNK